MIEKNVEALAAQQVLSGAASVAVSARRSLTFATYQGASVVAQRRRVGRQGFHALRAVVNIAWNGRC